MKVIPVFVLALLISACVRTTGPGCLPPEPMAAEDCPTDYPYHIYNGSDD